MIHRLILSLCFTVAAASSAQAEVILSNFGGSGNSFGFALYDAVYGAVGFQTGSQSYSLDGVDLRLNYGGGTPILQLREDNGADMPGTNVLAMFTSPPVIPGGVPETYHFTPSTVATLAAGTKYWFVLSSTAPDFGSTSVWHSHTSSVSPTGPAASPLLGYRTSGDAGTSWGSYVTSYSPAIEVHGTEITAVPEPTSLLLVAGAAAAGGWRRRFRRR